MKRFNPPLTAKAICQFISGWVIGDDSLPLNNVVQPKDSMPDSIIFLEQEKYLEDVQNAKAGLILTTKEFESRLPGKNLLIVPKPYYNVMLIVSYWQRMEISKRIHGIDPSARIAEGCRISDNVSIGANVAIGANCVIGAGTVIEANSIIAEDCELGEACHIYPHVSIYSDSKLGNRVIIHSGAVIGADGFGYLFDSGKQQKIPQIGNVVIHDDVEIGANSTIDRATFGSTIVGEGTKIDNLVQIGHNCVIGKHSILCAQVGLAGSTTIGDFVYLAGQVGVAGHLTIGNAAMVGAQSGVVSDIEPGAKYFGSPAREAGLTKRIMASEKHLPDIYRAYLKSQKET